jgi:hypothetical protein
MAHVMSWLLETPASLPTACVDTQIWTDTPDIYSYGCDGMPMYKYTGV